MRNPAATSVVLSLCLFGSYSGYAAKAIDLTKQPVSLLKSYVVAPSNLRSLTIKSDQVKETTRVMDRNQTTHIRMQQFHQGYPVWGADSVVHVPMTKKRMPALTLAAVPQSSGSSMNGVMYQDISPDLQNTPHFVFEKAQIEKANKQALQMIQQNYPAGQASIKQNRLMVYVGENGKARWAFLVKAKLKAASRRQLPAKPVYILDAQSLEVLKQWNDLKTMQVKGGGYGGNPRMGKVVYDGLPKDLVALNISRDSNNSCALENSDVIIKNGGNSFDDDVELVPVTFQCKEPDQKHNNVYWDGSLGSSNGGYSPDNDAFYAGSVIQALYKEWYGVPMLVNEDKSPMKLTMITHSGEDWENAVWDDEQNRIALGDGADTFYPLTSLGVIAHEVSHGFTQQHANLVYDSQSGGMNEAFSDMAAQAAEEFAYGKSSWSIGSEIAKQDDIPALRYMDQPSKDCEGREPGDWCSIDSATDFYKGLNVHFSSGVYNRAFYELAKTQGWGSRKAFEVMVAANSHYWTATSTFKQGACGVVSAAKDLHYDVEAVAKAFKVVGIDVESC